MRWTARKLVVGLTLLALSASAASAQYAPRDGGPLVWPSVGWLPGDSYWAAVAGLYAGSYHDAERALQRETERGFHPPETRWIDPIPYPYHSIPYHAMLGEVLYHEGRNAEALAEFDKVCQFWLAHPKWLQQVDFQFQQQPRPEDRVRRAPPWGRSGRQFVLGRFPSFEPVLVGYGAWREVAASSGFSPPKSSARPRNDILIQWDPDAPVFWKVNVMEVVRTSALAIRRRNELLGPLVAYDPLTKELSDMLSRGDLARADHWSNAWIELLRGLTQVNCGNPSRVEVFFRHSVVIDGQFDHPLTCAALLEQGRLAMLRGDNRRAAELLAEAGFSAYYYQNGDVLTESVTLGWLNHLASGSEGVYPPLEGVSARAQEIDLQHAATKLHLAEAESLLWLGQTDAAATVLDEAGRRIDQMRDGLPGIHQLSVQAAVQMARGQTGPGSQTLSQALARQAGSSLRNFQISRANDMYDAGVVEPRVAVNLYGALLADPTPDDWVYRPLEAMAVLQTPHDAAFDRWFLAALKCNDVPLALEIAERTKRQRFLASQPLGGRLLALRAILEVPTAALSQEAIQQRQGFLTSFPAYRDLANAGQRACDQLRAGPILADDTADAKTLAALYDTWAETSSQRQQMLALMALSRLPSALEFMPLLTTAELQRAINEGEALALFHAAAGNLYGFVLTQDGAQVWQLRDQRQLRMAVSRFLHDLGTYGRNRALSAAKLCDDGWQESAAKLYAALFADAPVDFAKIRGLVIVPDDVLWYLPFEALVPDGARPENVLADRVPIRYGPTAALALCNSRPLRRAQHTGIVANEPLAGDADADREAMLQQLEKVATGPVRLPSPLPEPAHLVAPLLDGLVVFDAVAADREAAYNISPLPQAHGKAEALQAWLGLPCGGPERVVLAGFTTEAAQGLRTPRRSSRGPAVAARPGEELFQSLCGLMAGGARTVLLSRWRTGGQTNFELVRQFVQELPEMPATEAWRRACILARETPLDAQREPRLKRPDENVEPPTADHPFFWAGYLLVDTSPRPERGK